MLRQVTELLGSSTRLPKGSQLLLTSRRSDVVAKYNPVLMEPLSDASALALLAWHAHGKGSLPAGLVEIGKDALRGCGGLPLAVKVLAGALCREPATPEAWKVHSWSVRRLVALAAVACHAWPGDDILKLKDLRGRQGWQRSASARPPVPWWTTSR